VGFGFLRVENIIIKIRNTLRINVKLALFSLKFRAKIKLLLALFACENIKIRIKNTLRFNQESALLLKIFALK
jgi:hypothetical protein